MAKKQIGFIAALPKSNPTSKYARMAGRNRIVVAFVLWMVDARPDHLSLLVSILAKAILLGRILT
jgi:hypothetical protein